MSENELNTIGAGHQIIHSEYVDLMKKRSLGYLPDMGCALRLSYIINQYFINENKNIKLKKILDVGCATGHYYRTFLNQNIPIEKYIGLERDPDMIQTALKAWSDEIQKGKIDFIQDDIESNNNIPESDLLICYNSFMYYKSAKFVLKKFLESSKNILIRSYFSENNFRILRGQSKQNNDNVDIDELEIFSDLGAIKSADYWTIYSFSYIEKIVKNIEPSAKVSWLEDKNIIESITNEKNIGVTKRGGTEIVGNYEISYPLLQPWEILMITR